MSEEGYYGLYGVGFNRFSQLEEDSIAAFVPKLLSEKWSLLCASWDAVVFQKGDGTLTVQGDSSKKQGLTLSKQHVSTIKCGHFHGKKLYLLDSEGNLEIYIDGVLVEKNEQDLSNLNSFDIKEVYSTVNPDCVYGLAETGELHHWNETSLPTQIFLPKQVTQVGCGISHCLALLQDNTVFSWGTGSRGQLGHSSLQDEAKPRLTDVLCGVSIKAIAAGGWHSLALADTGDVYIWGWNECGQLGFPVVEDLEDQATEKLASTNKGLVNGVAMLSSPTLLELEKYLNSEEFVSVKAVSCGSRHTAIVTNNGEAVTWGWGKYGQLAHQCCISSYDKIVTTSEGMGVKRAKMIGRSEQGCHQTPHLPDYVEYFRTREITIESVQCVAWNTFFKTDRKL